MRKILKEALTICHLIDEMQDRYPRDEIPNSKLSFVKRIVKNFLRRMKTTEYYNVKDQYGNTYYQNIQDHIESSTDEYRSKSVYLTYVQMQFHSFVRHYLPKRMGFGNYRRNTKYVSYYKSTLEELL